MTKFLIIALFIAAIVIMFLLWILIKKFRDDKIESAVKKLQQEQNAKEQKKNEQKEQMETGSNNADFFNSVDVLRNL
jgi:hypothetical protein